jgi:hypothetical protein
VRRIEIATESEMKNMGRILLLLGASLIAGIGCGNDGSGYNVLDDPLGSFNRAPLMQEQPDTSVALGDTLRLQASAYDPDGDEITYRIVVYVETIYEPWPDIEFNSSTGRFWFAPAASDLPERAFEFIARDGRGGESSTKFAVDVITLNESGGQRK